LDQQIHIYDRAVLDTFVGELPPEHRKRVIESVTEDGIPGRTKVAQGALKALKEQWLQEGARTAALPSCERSGVRERNPGSIRRWARRAGYHSFPACLRCSATRGRKCVDEQFHAGGGWRAASDPWSLAREPGL
jgi:hypothetical protein